MARIRTVKPEFLRHYGLYQAEIETGFPIRVAFLGLWTAADREGRFRWRPAELKLDCLPHDQVDFEAVLISLCEHGFIIQYEVGGQLYGYIPSWKTHQVINLREAQSTIPDPENGKISVDQILTYASTCTHVGKGKEGKGREGERKGTGKDSASLRSAGCADPQSGPAANEKPQAKSDGSYDLWAAEFQEHRLTAYQPRKADFVQLAALRKASNLNGHGMPEHWQSAIHNYLASPLSRYTLADLCSRYDIFVRGQVDRYGRPAGFNDVRQHNEATAVALSAKGFFDE